MIEVQCKCGKSFRVDDEHAGRVGRCSACGRQVMIPSKPAKPPQAEVKLELVDEKAALMAQRQKEYDALRQAIAKDPTDPQPHLGLADLCSELGRKPEALEHYRAAYALDASLSQALDKIEAIAGPIERAKLEPEEDEAEAPGDDFWPLLIRSFIFPFSGTGIFILIAGSVLFLIVDFSSNVTVFGRLAGFLGFLYLVRYAFDIIGHTANGRDEPPDWPDLTGVTDFLWCLFLLIVSFVAAILPAAAYLCLGGRSESALWAWTGVGLFYFPLCLLAVVILQTPLAVLPHVIFPPIWRTHVRYVATVLVVFVAYGMAMITQVWGSIPFVSQFLAIYFLLVEMHAIGIFYRTNEARIGWLKR